MPQTEQFDSHGQTSSDFTQNPNHAYQILPDSKCAYTDPALIDFSGIFSITLNSMRIRSVLKTLVLLWDYAQTDLCGGARNLRRSQSLRQGL